ncbi:unnamed protein product [Rhodiola kirilowii]
MAKKRKSVATRMDEVDRNMYTTFCTAANSLSQLYSNAMSQQRLSFQAGERHALEKLYHWIGKQQEEGQRVNTGDIMVYLKNEIDYGSEDLTMSTRLPQNNFQPTNSAAPVSSGLFGSVNAGQGARLGLVDHQTKNSVFSNALCSPMRRNLQHYQLAQGGLSSNNVLPSGMGTRSHENTYPSQENRESNSHNSNDSMDMHSESPGHESAY